MMRRQGWEGEVGSCSQRPDSWHLRESRDCMSVLCGEQAVTMLEEGSQLATFNSIRSSNSATYK
jgi:hypothetical protein